MGETKLGTLPGTKEEKIRKGRLPAGKKKHSLV